MSKVKFKNYYDICHVSNPAVSSDGTQVAYQDREPVNDRSHRNSIYVVDVETGSSERITPPHGSDASPTWSPSGDRIAFISSRGETGRSQVWVRDLESGGAEPVTAVPGGVSSLAWRPDGNAIAFLQEPLPEELDEGLDAEVDPAYSVDDPDPRRITQTVYRMEAAQRTARGNSHYFDGATSQVYVVDLEKSSVSRVTETVVDHFEPAWGMNEELYFIRAAGELNDTTSFEVCVTDQRSDPDVLAETTIQPPSRNTLAATTDDRVAYLCDPYDERLYPQAEVRVLDRETGEIVHAGADLDRYPSNATGVMWGDDEAYLYFGINDQGAMAICRTQPFRDEPPERVADGSLINGASVGGGRVAITQAEWNHPGNVFVTDGDSLKRLTNINEEYLADLELSEPEEFWVERNGMGVHGWIITPPDFDPDETYPMILHIHGGPPNKYTKGSRWHRFQAVAARGYVVVFTNPRGSIGYGEEFLREVAGDKPNPCHKDLMAVVDHIVEYDFIDEDALFVTGGSYGGYMTGWVIGQTDRFSAAVARRGNYDLQTSYGTSSIGTSLESRYYGVAPWENPELYWKHSPVAHVDNINTPILIIACEHDYNTPVDTSEMLYRYLKKAGVETELVVFPRDGHFLPHSSGEPKHVVENLEITYEWIDCYSPARSRESE